MLRMTPLALGLSLAGLASPLLASAQEPSAPAATTLSATPVAPVSVAAPAPAELLAQAGAGPGRELLADAGTLKAITVTATRSERAVDEVPVTVTVTERADIERRQARNLKDLLDDEIDLSVRSAAARFGTAAATGRAGVEGINIRGLEGNQVLMTVDGIRVPNAFSFAAFSTGRGDYVNADGLKSVEVLRGPASMQFGSDGLAGAVSFRTLDPGDVLSGESRLGGFTRLGYAGVDSSRHGTLALAGRSSKGASTNSGDWQGLLLGSLRSGHETKNQGHNHSLNSDRTAPNPQDYDSGYLLAKAIYSVNSAHQVGLTLESLRRQQDTQVYSGRAKAPLTATSVVNLESEDKVTRERVSLEHRYADSTGVGVQRAQMSLYWQGANTRQQTFEDRNSAADRARDNLYESKVWGLSSVLQSNFTLGLPQLLSYGFDWSRSDSSALRDGTVAPMGERFPARPFPTTAYTVAGAFVQSEMQWGAVSLTPGLRFDSYDLKPEAEGFMGAVTNLSGRAASPRLGALWQLSTQFAPYVQWARGFRAPTPDQVNNGFTNPVQGYGSMGNPDLKAERASSWELGARGQLGAWRYAVAAFDNRYSNFIDQQVVKGTGRPNDPMIFQYINRSGAHIRGAQLRADWDMAPQWVLSTGLAYTKGDSEVGGQRQPLESINPLKAVLGVRYSGARWGLDAQALYHGKKSASSTPLVASSSSHTGAPEAAFIPSASTVVDIGGYYKPTPRLTLQARIGNLFDRTYWRWQDARGLAASSSVKDAYSAPGRNLQISLKYDFY